MTWDEDKVLDVLVDNDYDDDDDGDGDDDDIYYDEVSVCLSVTINHHFRAERQRREVRRLPGLAGRRVALA